MYKIRHKGSTISYVCPYLIVNNCSLPSAARGNSISGGQRRCLKSSVVVQPFAHQLIN